jgi:hypothetical protein
MGYLDFIRKLRTGTPNVAKTAKTFRVAGFVCIFVGVWNLVTELLIKKSHDPFMEDFPFTALHIVVISLLSCGAICLVAARRIREMDPIGKRLGQLAIALGIASLTAFVILVFLLPLMERISRGMGNFLMIPLIVSLLFLAQLAVPAYFAIRYLERLPVVDDPYAIDRQLVTAQQADRERGLESDTSDKATYASSPLPFGVLGTFFLMLVVAGAILHGSDYFLGESATLLTFLLVFLGIFIGPVSYNFVPSPFQEDRQIIDSYICGGSTFLFQATVPFFRLLLYNDGLEVRFMLQRYFIPYDRMAASPEKTVFFSSGLLIESDLPGVPSSIGIAGTGTKELLGKINQLRDAYLAAGEKV